MSARRGLVLAIAGCLLSGVAILYASGRVWARVDYGPSDEVVDADVFTGSLAAWAFVALAGVVAVAATRRWGRVPVGLALAAAGGVVAWLAFDAIYDTERRAWEATGPGGVVAPVAWPVYETAWPFVTLAAGALLLATGAYVAVRGPSWPALGSRYDAPRARDDAWSVLDRGEDPTA